VPALRTATMPDAWRSRSDGEPGVSKEVGKLFHTAMPLHRHALGWWNSHGAETTAAAPLSRRTGGTKGQAHLGLQHRTDLTLTRAAARDRILVYYRYIDHILECPDTFSFRSIGTLGVTRLDTSPTKRPWRLEGCCEERSCDSATRRTISSGRR
jgi:hypothetical protein